jgi:hypothetical protein
MDGGASLLECLLTQAQDVLQIVEECHSTAVSEDDSTTEGSVCQLLSALTCFGCTLAAVLPSKACCNHTGCSNLARLSEAGLVGGKACVCGK